MSAVDLDQARRFLDLLDEEAPAFTFQTATDAEPKPRPDPLARIINLPPDNLKPLVSWNGNGAAVWVTVNETVGKSRTAENVTRVRAVFADLDGAPLDPVLRCELEPHVVVESSPGKFHAYWLVDGLPLDQFEAVQRRIAETFHADPSISDLCRVMRLPGLTHAKDPAAPFVVRIVHQAERLPYTAAEILAAFPPLVEERRKPARGIGAHPDSPFGAINDAALANLPAWVPALFPTARQSKPRWRVSSADLGRGLEEDLSITPQGAKYFGVHDMGDARAGRRTPIDLVIEYGAAPNAAAAAGWLAARLGIEFRAAASPEEDHAEPASEYDAAVARLAKLKPADYDRARKSDAERLGVRVGTLDRDVEAARPAQSAPASAAPEAEGEIEPWPDPIAGPDLMTSLVTGIKRYAVLQTDAQATAVALWAIHAHTMNTAEVAPRLMITSPVPECGKTVLLGVVGRLVPRPEISSNISPAALFRTIELIRPSVLVDEADTFLGENDELRGLLNSGHTRTSAYTRRMVKVGEDMEPRKFSTWAAICIAGIGKLHPSIMGRSLVVTMQRKLAAQKVARLLSRGGKDLNDLARKIARWVADHRAPLATLADVEPALPNALGNRSADNWIELIGLADLIGGDWPTLARRAAVEISTNADVDDQSYGVQLLADMQTVFASTKVEGIWTEDLLRHLHAMPERPWSEYGRQRKPITDRGVATLLKDFGVRSKQVWKGEPPTGANKRGYVREDLESAFSRYVDASRSARALEPKESATHGVFRSARADETLADEKTPKATATARSSALADGEALGAGKESNHGPQVAACAWCHKPVALESGHTATSSGEILHNGCVDEWSAHDPR